ncbi:MAG: hypothetical protein MZV64_11980 [Ignavibacteriales bacterium]|nr:hypothetical protein [Ignavibacteriales bacterium]
MSLGWNKLSTTSQGGELAGQVSGRRTGDQVQAGRGLRLHRHGHGGTRRIYPSPRRGRSRSNRPT